MSNSGTASGIECLEARTLPEEVVASKDSIKGLYETLVLTHSKLLDQNAAMKTYTIALELKIVPRFKSFRPHCKFGGRNMK